MQTHHFGPTLRNVSTIGQGTWCIDEAERDTAMIALRCGLDLGLTHIDTAEYYGWGAAEKMVGEVIADRGTMSSWFPRSFPTMPRAARRSKRANGR